jgi:acyl carrier protein
MDALETTVKELIGATAGYEPEDLKDGDTLVEDLGLDSLELVRLALDIEEQFDVEVPDEAIKPGMTVSEVVAAVRGLAA